MTDKKIFFYYQWIADACDKNFEPRFFDFYDEMFQKNSGHH